MKKLGLGLAATWLAGALVLGCGTEGDDIILGGGGGTAISTRADSISSRLDESWADNETSINGANVQQFSGLRVFRARDGGGMAVFRQGDTGTEQLYVARYATNSPLEEPHRVVADVRVGGFVRSVETFVTVFTPNGDAVMAFIAEQDVDRTPGSTDLVSERVYVLTWSVTTGFSPAVAVDTNTPGIDDNAVGMLFVGTNLVDGDEFYGAGGPGARANFLDRTLTGHAGDAPSNLTPFLFLGWFNALANGDLRVEGRFVDLTTLARGPIVDVTNTGFAPLSTGESVIPSVLASGRDLLFRYDDTSGTPPDEHLVLVRLDPVTRTVAHTVDLRRGTNTNPAGWNVGGIFGLIGDGFRPLHGQDETWIVLADTGFQDGTVTQADDDLVVFQVSADGATVTAAEFDHNPPNAASANDPVSLGVQLNRGASVAFLFYRQQFDVTGGPATNLAFFARALRLNGAETLADNLSNEVTINTFNDSNDDGDADVERGFVFDLDPFCSPDANDTTTYAAYRQVLDNDPAPAGVTLRGRTLAITDITARPIALTAGPEAVIAANADPSSARRTSFDLGTGFDTIVLESSDPAGGGLVFFVGNGNSPDDAGAGFPELRPFVFAHALPTGAGTQSFPATQVGSETTTAPALPFPDWAQVADDNLTEIEAVVTPSRAAERDFTSYGVSGTTITFDREILPPAYAFFFFPEIRSGDDELGGVSWSARTLDLGATTFTDVLDRFGPDLDLPPARLNDGGEHTAGDLTDSRFVALSQEDVVLTVFNLTHGTQTGSPSEGRYYVNVVQATGEASDAALLTSDSNDELEDHDQGPELNGDEALVVPGHTCDGPVGAWFFYLRNDQTTVGGLPSWDLQGRRFNNTGLPRR